MHYYRGPFVLIAYSLFLCFIFYLTFNHLVVLLEMLQNITVGPYTMYSNSSIEPQSHLELFEEEMDLSFFEVGF